MNDYDTVTIRGVPLMLYRYEALSEAIRQAGDFYEADVLDDLRALLPSHGTIVDVGANIGNHAAYWAAFVPYKWLVAFEPVPDNYALLRLNLASAERTMLSQSAVSDVLGPLEMDVDAVNMGRSRVVDVGSITVDATPLDLLALDDVTLLKIDTEGHEPRVLMGARHTIARWHPAIVVEDNDGAFGEHLAAHGLDGYRCTRTWPGANTLWQWQ